MAGRNLRINEGIVANEVRLISQDGDQSGVLSTLDALEQARELNLDLVEISPQASPPVCKLLNYGKYKYELEKKSREQKKNTNQTKLKEVRMQPKIESHDIAFKSKHVQEFLGQGNKVKVTVRFRGRELAHTELGKVKLDEVLTLLDSETYKVDVPARMEGRFMSMFLSPRSKKN